MTIGKWLGTHPPLSERLAALQPGLVEGRMRSEVGVARAIVALVFTTVAVAGSVVVFTRTVGPAFQQALAGAHTEASPQKADPRVEATYDLTMMVRLALAYQQTSGSFPEDAQAMRRAWELNHPHDAYPLDPFDGKPYGYAVRGDHVLVWSCGPDRLSGTSDDIQINSKDVVF
jgi:hypothetical protein